MPEITDPQVAAAVITACQQHNIYTGEMPADDAGKVQVANEYLKLAEDAAKIAPGPAVEAVLGAAGQAMAAPAAAPPAPAAPEQVAAAPTPPSAPPAPTTVKIRNPADDQVYDVPADQAQQYLDGGYVLVDAPAPPPPPAASATPDSAQTAPAAALAVAEPWDGYKDETIPKIVERIEETLRSQGEAAKPMLAAVWEFENANKKRKRLLDKLSEIATQGVSVAPAAPEPTPAAPPLPEPPAAAAPPAAPAAPVNEGDDVRPESPFAQAPPPPPPSAPPAAAPQAAPAPPTPPATPDVATPAFDVLVPPYENKATTLATQAVAREHLPVPHDAFAEGSPPQIPADFTALADVEVARLQSQFNACYARAYYLLAVAEGHSADAKMVGDGHVKDYISKTEWAKGTTVAEMEAKAAQAPEVGHARRVAAEWGGYAKQLAHLATIYEKTIERLSREQTRRDTDKALPGGR